MKIYIQSKTGDYNTEVHVHNANTMAEACRLLRAQGGYYQGEKDEKELFVPFEQIEYIQQISSEVSEVA